MKTVLFPLVCAFTGIAALANPITLYLDIHVPGSQDLVFVDDHATKSTGTPRSVYVQLSRAGNYRYTVRVEHEGIKREKVVHFTGNEGRINVYFMEDDFASGKLAALASSLRSGYRAQDPSRVGVAREELRRAMSVLGPMIDRSQGAESWRKSFSWNELLSQIKSAEPDSKRLDTIYRGLFFKHAGMEYPEVERFRNAVGEFRDAVDFSTLANGEATYQKTLQELADLIPRFEAKQRAEDRIELSRRMGWLERARLAPSLVAALRARYGRSNSVMQVNISLVEKYAVKPVQQAKSGNQMILGNPTHSNSSVTGQTYLRFVPNNACAEVEVGMTGRMHTLSSSSGGARGVSVQVHGETVNDVHVYKRISVAGLSLDKIVQHPPMAYVQPVWAATPNIQVQARGLFRGLKTRIAYNTAMSRVPAGQAEGRRIAAGELASSAAQQQVQLPSEAQNVAQQFQGLIQTFIVLEQKRAGVYPREQWTASDSEWLYAKHIRRTQSELSSFTPAPAFKVKPLQLGIRLHESEITNDANWQLSGQPLSDADLEGFARSIFNYVPASLRLGTHAPRWKTHLIEDHPFVIDFDTDSATLVIRFKSLEIAAHGGEAAASFKTPFSLHVKYRAQVRKDWPMLERLEDVSLKALEGNEELSPAMVDFLLPRLQAFFKEEVYFDGFTPVRSSIFEPLTKIKIEEFRTENQWFLFGGNLNGDLLEILKSTPSGLGGDTTVIPQRP